MPRLALDRIIRFNPLNTGLTNLRVIQPPDQRICPLCKTGLEDEEHFLMNCIAYRDPRRDLFNTLKKETNLILDSMTPSSAFTTLISMKQGEKTQKIVAKRI